MGKSKIKKTDEIINEEPKDRSDAEKTENRVKELILKLCGMTCMPDDAVLLSELAFDSLLMVTLLIKIEEEFNIELDEADMDPFELKSVLDVISLVKKYCLDDGKGGKNKKMSEDKKGGENE
mgnify:FL=1